MIATIAARELRSLLVSPFAWSILAVVQALTAWMFLVQIDLYLALQPKLAASAAAPGVSSLVAAPYLANAGALLLFFLPLLSMGLLSAEYRRDSIQLLFSSPITLSQIALGKYLAVLGFAALLVGLVSLMPLSLALATRLDLGRLAAGVFGMALLLAAAAALGLAVSARTRQPAAAGIITLGILGSLWLADAADGPWFEWLSLPRHYQHLLRGLVRSSDIVYFLLLSALGVLSAVLALDERRSQGLGGAGGRLSRLRRRLASLLTYALLSAATVLLAVLSLRYETSWDWTWTQSNSLSEPSLQLLDELPEPPRFTAYVREDRLLRQQVSDLVARYQRARPGIELEFVDPEHRPEMARELGISEPIEIEVRVADRREKVTQADEQGLTQALHRVRSRDQIWIVALSGHGERDLRGTASHALGHFGQRLDAQGLRIQELNLATTPLIPDNTRVLVVASPRGAWLPGEQNLILRFLKAGGNLLWLVDPGEQADTEFLAVHLGLHLLPGVVVDANAQVLGLDDPAFAPVARYPDHPITRGLDTLTLFPRAAGIQIEPGSAWQWTPILRTSATSWNETQQLQGELRLQAERNEHRGPLDLGVAAWRALRQGGESREQRLVVIGDADFLSNGFLGSGSNLALGLRILRWLSGEDRLIQIPAPEPPDRALDLPPAAGAVLGLGFLLGLPLAFLLTGAIVWWRRQRR